MSNVIQQTRYPKTLYILLGVQLCFRRFPIDGFSDKWWSK